MTFIPDIILAVLMDGSWYDDVTLLLLVIYTHTSMKIYR